MGISNSLYTFFWTPEHIDRSNLRYRNKGVIEICNQDWIVHYIVNLKNFVSGSFKYLKLKTAGERIYKETPPASIHLFLFRLSLSSQWVIDLKRALFVARRRLAGLPVLRLLATPPQFRYRCARCSGVKAKVAFPWSTHGVDLVISLRYRQRFVLATLHWNSML